MACVARIFAALAAAALLPGSSVAASRVDAGLTLELVGGAPVAGQTFRVSAVVQSQPVPNGPPFEFNLTLALPDDVELVSATNPFEPIQCEVTGRSVTCRYRTIGADVSAIVDYRLRAPRIGSYVFRAAVEVLGAPDTDPSSNTAELTVGTRAPPLTGVRGSGTAGPDSLSGSAAADRLFGLGGRDTLRGLAGNDTLDGGSGDDLLLGGPGRDRLLGGTGNDRLDGGVGDDTLLGGPGTNRYAGGSGADKITSRNDRQETVVCGTGRDTVTADREDRLLGCEVARRL